MFPIIVTVFIAIAISILALYKPWFCPSFLHHSFGACMKKKHNLQIPVDVTNYLPQRAATAEGESPTLPPKNTSPVSMATACTKCELAK